MPSCPTLHTARLVLRPFREEDAGPYGALLRTPDVAAALHLDPLPDDAAAWEQMARWLGMWELRGCGQWAVAERSTGVFVGRAGLHRPPGADWPGLEVGWVLHPDVWGRGLATEAGARSVAYAFDDLAVDEVVSVILPENVRSQAVARRLGFTWSEDRVLSTYPAAAHGIWRLARHAWVPGRLSAG